MREEIRTAAGESRLVARRHDRPQSSLRDLTRCIVVARGEEAPAALMASFERDGVAIEHCQSLTAAFAALLCSRQSAAKTENWGLPKHAGPARDPDVPTRGDVVGLLVVSRDRWNQLDRFLAAVDRHAPGAPVWVGAESLLIEVRTQTEEKAPESRPAGPSRVLDEPRPVRVPHPSLRLTPTETVEGAETESEGDPRSRAPLDSHTPEPTAPSPRSSPSARPEAGQPLDPDVERSPRPGSDSAVTKDEIEMLLRLFDDMNGARPGAREDEGRDPTSERPS